MSREVRFRIGGAIAIALAIGLGWFEIWKPLQAAEAQSATVRFYPKIFALVPVCLVFGIAFLIGGDRIEYRDEDARKLTTAGWALFAITAILAAIFYF